MAGGTAATLAHALRERAQRTPADRAYLFLLDGEHEEAPVTFSELDARARAGAALLQERGVDGGRALLLYAPGPEYVTGFFACLYAGVVAVPAFPPRPDRPDQRIAAIIHDCAPACVLTQSWIRDQRETLVGQTPSLGDRPWLALDADVSPDAADAWRDPAQGPEALAFLQYTSGSTADPKGVMVSHENVMTNVSTAYRAFGYGPSTVGVSWLPPYHDMGLIGAVLLPACAGIPVVMMSPLAFLQRPARWLEALSRYRGTVSGAPSSAYQLCVDRVTDEELAGLDLRQWSSAMNGAEPVRASVVDRFSERFAPCGFRREAFYPCYGLAEATLLVAGAKRAPGPIRRLVDRRALRDGRLADAAPGDPSPQALVASGLPPPGVTVEIVDPVTLAPCPPGIVGEVWVAGRAVARGYWGDPEGSRATFGWRLPGRGETFLRTGDLGAIGDGGHLFVTGRLSDVIVVRGRNHYPQDLEATVERCHPALAPNRCAAFAIERDDEERLVVVHELPAEAEVAAPEIVATIRRAISEEHELSVHAVVLVARRGLPRTSSGKIQRRPCRQAFLEGRLPVVHEWREPVAAVPASGGRRALVDELGRLAPARRHEQLRDRLAVSLAAVLGLGGGERVDPGRPLAELGLDSVAAVELSALLSAATGVRLPATAVFDHPTLDALATFILGELLPDAEPPAAGAPDPDRVSLAAIERLSDDEAEALLNRSVTALLGGVDD